MKIFFSALVIIFTGFSTLADSYEGKISKNKAKTELILLNTINTRRIQLTGATPVINKLINSLKTGDFISLEGELSEPKSALRVSLINYVGLTALLGNWIGNDSYCYNFLSFTEFSVSKLNVEKKCLPPSRPNFTYLVSPGEAALVMLISGENGSYIGDLSFNTSRDLEIKLYDSETGGILRKIHLRK